MDNKVLRRLNILKQKNTDPNWVNKDSELYSFLLKKETYILAYENIKSNKGSLTPGTDNKTLDGFSDKTIQRICDQMKTEQYTFSRAKRIYIPKASGKLRPLGIPTATDKILQEIIRIILEAIWDSPKGPQFSEVSHGFRPGKGTHSALQLIDQKFKNMKWVIEGDIEKAYDSINHTILLNILEKRIQPGKFLRLVRKTLNAGYLEYKIPVNSIIGTPQGSVVSPILANIYFHELDIYILQLIKQIEETYNVGKTFYKARNPEYVLRANALRRYKRRHEKLLTKETSKKLKQAKLELLKQDISISRQLPIRIKYVRYADDWIIGVDGNLEIAKKIKCEIQNFLKQTLKLQLNETQTKITHVKSKEFFFLGYTIGISASVKIGLIKSKKLRKNFLKRTTGYLFTFKAPIPKLIKKLYEKGFCTVDGFPTSRKSWTVLEDHVIVTNFNYILRGLLGYYSGAHNQKSLRNIQYILQYSCAMTLGHRHRMSIPKIFKKFGTTLKVCNKKNQTCLALEKFSKRKRVWRVSVPYSDEFFLNIRTKVTKSGLGLPCCICDSPENVEMHHVKHVRKANFTYKGFHEIMHLLNRKQIPVCQSCHNKIHRGEYDGLKLGDIIKPK